MKAILYHQYGSPDVMRLQEVEKPSVTVGDVLVQVRGAAEAVRYVEKGHARGKVLVRIE